ncbi:hypothetical protein UlMin_039733 [Ulmus minor]
MASHQALIISLSLLQLFSGTLSTTFTIINNCNINIWPAITPNDVTSGSLQLTTTGFALKPGESNTVTVQPNWSGRLWGRTFCTTTAATNDPNATAGKFTCATGDCGSAAVECSGQNNISPPATVAEFTINGQDGLESYSVSLVDGYNLPIMVVPQVSGGNCGTVGCVIDLNAGCPRGLQVMYGGESVGCKSNSISLNDNSFSGDFFLRYCPQARTTTADDTTKRFRCASADFYVSFCPAGFPSSTTSSTTGSSATTTTGSWNPASGNYNPGRVVVDSDSDSDDNNFRTAIILLALACFVCFWGAAICCFGFKRVKKGIKKFFKTIFCWE